MLSMKLTSLTIGLLMVVLLPSSLFATNKLTSSTVHFFSEELTIHYSPDIVLDTRICAKGKCINDFYEQMEAADYNSLLTKLQEYKERLQLNDWLYYELVRSTVGSIYSKKNEMQQTMTCWFFMAKSGYDARISHLALEKVFLYIHTKEVIYDIPLVKEDGRLFVNLTQIHQPAKYQGKYVNRVKLVPNETGVPFSFKLDKLPLLKATVIDKNITFKHGEEEHNIVVKTDKNISDLLTSCPRIDDLYYLNLPLSNTTGASLIPQLELLMEGKSNKEKLEFLVSFTRSAFDYKWDYQLYDINMPLSAEQVFAHEFSDHEDRCALFINLAKELIGLPMIVVAYDDYMSVGVATKEVLGKAITYEGKDYYICDPTTPSNSKEVGSHPNGIRGKKVEVITTYE